MTVTAALPNECPDCDVKTLAWATLARHIRATHYGLGRHTACGTRIVLRDGVEVCPRCEVENPR